MGMPMKELFRAKPSTDLVFTDMLMEMFTKVNGKMMNNKEMVHSDLQMVQYIRASFLKDNLMEKVSTNINQYNTTI